MNKKIQKITFKLFNKEYNSSEYMEVGYEQWLPYFGWSYSKNGFAYNGIYIPHTHKELIKND